MKFNEVDFDTYLKMHQIGKTTYDVEKTYGERWMPSEHEITERFAKLYKNNFTKKQRARLLYGLCTFLFMKRERQKRIAPAAICHNTPAGK